MIDFSLSDEQKQLRDLTREFTQKEIKPVAAEYDKKAEFPTEVIKKAWELGLMNIQVPEEYGGAGLGVLDDCLIAEEFGVGCTGIGTSMMSNMLAEGPLLVAANEEQKKKYLGQMVEEFSFSAYAVTEPGAGSDVAGIKTNARKVGNDYVINGQKTWASRGAYAHWLFGMFRTDPASERHHGLSFLLVPLDAPGITVRPIEKLNNKAAFAEIFFDDARVPGRERLRLHRRRVQAREQLVPRAHVAVAALAHGTQQPEARLGGGRARRVGGEGGADHDEDDGGGKDVLAVHVAVRCCMPASVSTRWIKQRPEETYQPCRAAQLWPSC